MTMQFYRIAVLARTSRLILSTGVQEHANIRKYVMFRMGFSFPISLQALLFTLLMRRAQVTCSVLPASHSRALMLGN